MTFHGFVLFPVPMKYVPLFPHTVTLVSHEGGLLLLQGFTVVVWTVMAVGFHVFVALCCHETDLSLSSVTFFGLLRLGFGVSL